MRLLPTLLATFSVLLSLDDIRAQCACCRRGCAEHFAIPLDGNGVPIPETGSPGTVDTPAAAPGLADVGQADFGAGVAGLGASFGATAGLGGAPNMIGDSLIGGGMLTHMGTGASQQSAASLYSFHMFKVAEDESPFPRNRVYFDVNSYSNVPGTDDITRFMIGLERTFWSDMVSIGLRLPIWAADIEPTPTAFPAAVPFGPEGSDGDIGDLTVTLKGALLRRPNRLLSAGLSVTTPTGPDTLGGVAPYYTFDNVAHRGAIQPWIGWYGAADSPAQGWFTQGFAAFDLLLDSDDADYFYLDLGVGHRLPRYGFITAVTPIFEAHWSAPMNDREQPFSLTALGLATLPPGGIASITSKTLSYRHQVNLTAAVNLELQNTKTLALGFVVPTVGPRVMDFELVAQFNCFAW